MKMKKLALCAMVWCLGLASSFAVSDGEIHARAAVLMDAQTGEVLYSKNGDEKLYPGGTTMIMTALLGAEAGDTVLDGAVHFSDDVTKLDRDVAVLGISADHPVTLRNALTAMMTYTGCDAALDTAVTVAPSVADFVHMMNDKAVTIGATNTHFTNPHGLPDENHYTSSYDIYLILKAVMENKDLREILSQKEYQVIYKDRNGARKSQVWKATNLYSTGEKVLPEALRITGAKTGTTKDAGYCLALNTEKKDSSISYISVVMKSESKDNLYQNMTNLLAKIS